MPQTLADNPLPSPCLIVVGSVVKMAVQAQHQKTMTEEA